MIKVCALLILYHSCLPQPDNVLLTLDGYVKLADMGAARGIAENGGITSNGPTASSEKTAKSGPPMCALVPCVVCCLRVRQW